MEEIVNKVAQSGLVNLDLEDFLPKEQVLPFDLKDHLYQGLILKEKEFRESLRSHDWNRYEGSAVAVFCSEDAIIPLWAYMLATTYLAPVAASVHYGAVQKVRDELLLKNIAGAPLDEYRDKRVLVKGCSNYPVPVSAYVSITSRLLPVVRSLMFGEACSNVPLFKSK